MSAVDHELRFEDHFCGAGGNTTAIVQAGCRVVHAANHSKVAISSHSANYPEVEHTLGDIPSMDPRLVPEADVLITSPECRARSYARGRPKDDPHLFAPGDGLDEKSRATMDEVTRFAEVRRYKAIVVENVPQLVDWCEPIESGHWPQMIKGKEVKCNCGVTFRRWLTDMINLGYEHRKLFWNSAFFPPTPQSRDRIYVVFWRKGQRMPALDHHPYVFCNACQSVEAGVQTMKPHLKMPATVAKAWGPHDTVWGRYAQQYFYACPRCGERAAPAITPAATAIEWEREGVKIGEREQHGLAPLAAGTIARCERGLEKLADRPMVVPLWRLADMSVRCRGADHGDVLPTQTTRQELGLVVQVGGNLGRLKADGSIDRAAVEKSWSTDEQLRTLHGSLDKGLLVPAGGPRREPRGTSDPMNTVLTRETHGIVMGNMNNNVPVVAADEPMSTVTTGNKLYVIDPWIVPYRKNTEFTPAGEGPMHTVTAEGNQHYLLERPAGMIVANYGSPDGPESKAGWARDAEGNPLGSVTTRDSHAIVTLRGLGQAHRVEDPMLTVATVEQHTVVGVLGDIMDCTFRMLEPSEIGRGMVMHVNGHGGRYVIHGTRREQVKQLGNAVTPPPMKVIVLAIRDSLDER